MQDTNNNATNVPTSPKPTVRQIDFFQLGHDRIVESGATEVDEVDLRVIQNHAAAVACETHQEKYDPDNNPADAAREAENAKVLKDRTKIEGSLGYADAECRDAGHTLGQKHEAGRKPAPHPLLLLLPALLIAITMASTISDRFLSGIADDILRFSLAGVFGIIFGAATVALIMYGHGERGERPAASYGTLAAVVVFAIACGGIRYSMASTTEEVIFAVFLAGLETAIVIFLEFRAATLRHELKAWGERKDIEDVAKRMRDSAFAESERLKALLLECNQKIQAHIAYVESRKPRFSTSDEAAAAAMKQAADGAYAGAARNRGLLLGARRRS